MAWFLNHLAVMLNTLRATARVPSVSCFTGLRRYHDSPREISEAITVITAARIQKMVFWVLRNSSSLG